MTRGGRRENLARHLCAVARHWPLDPAAERRLWDALPFADRDYWRFIADRARRFIHAEDVADHEAEIRADVAGLLDARFDQAGERLADRPPPRPPTPTACLTCGRATRARPGFEDGPTCSC